eukprot:351375-Chlamydomonas_euryale.AAC.13
MACRAAVTPGQLHRRRISSPHKQPVVDVAHWVRHERSGLIMSPLAVHNELVLVIAAHDKGRGEQASRQPRMDAWTGNGRWRVEPASRGTWMPHAGSHRAAKGERSSWRRNFQARAGQPEPQPA